MVDRGVSVTRSGVQIDSLEVCLYTLVPTDQSLGTVSVKDASSR